MSHDPSHFIFRQVGILFCRESVEGALTLQQLVFECATLGVAPHSSVQGVVEDSAAGLSLKTKTSTFLLFHRV